MARAHTIKCGELRCPDLNPGSYINYAMSLPTELSSRGQLSYILYQLTNNFQRKERKKN